MHSVIGVLANIITVIIIISACKMFAVYNSYQDTME